MACGLRRFRQQHELLHGPAHQDDIRLTRRVGQRGVDRDTKRPLATWDRGDLLRLDVLQAHHRLHDRVEFLRGLGRKFHAVRVRAHRAGVMIRRLGVEQVPLRGEAPVPASSRRGPVDPGHARGSRVPESDRDRPQGQSEKSLQLSALCRPLHRLIPPVVRSTPV
ncbi:MAG: hypothetical protein AUH35_03290 [Nitrospirae bacterium 13_1_40CM_62_7]|nr:MAG: hypothetical protein AUH35_03290 [Nitrospirae bacterium 13_1_40CM_62_7]